MTTAAVWLAPLTPETYGALGAALLEQWPKAGWEAGWTVLRGGRAESHYKQATGRALCGRPGMTGVYVLRAVPRLGARCERCQALVEGPA